MFEILCASLLIEWSAFFGYDCILCRFFFIFFSSFTQRHWIDAEKIISSAFQNIFLWNSIKMKFSVGSTLIFNIVAWLGLLYDFTDVVMIFAVKFFFRALCKSILATKMTANTLRKIHVQMILIDESWIRFLYLLWTQQHQHENSYRFSDKFSLMKY